MEQFHNNICLFDDWKTRQGMTSTVYEMIAIEQSISAINERVMNYSGRLLDD
jgi:hypothetical protein